MRPFFSLLVTLTFAASSAFASDHQHHGEQQTLQMNKDKQWQTDATLRNNMSSLADTLRVKTKAIHKGELTSAEYAALGAAVDTSVGDIVKNCKLPADADAMLHIVIGELIAAAETMRGTANANKAGAAHQAVVALNNYGRYFKHPGWVPIVTP
jgi:hypothetical protein